MGRKVKKLLGEEGRGRVAGGCAAFFINTIPAGCRYVTVLKHQMFVLCIEEHLFKARNNGCLTDGCGDAHIST